MSENKNKKPNWIPIIAIGGILVILGIICNNLGSGSSTTSKPKCSSTIRQELHLTSADIGDTTSETFDVNMKALQGIWQDIETSNSCDRTVRSYMMQFFDSALAGDYEGALEYLDKAENYLSQ